MYIFSLRYKTSLISKLKFWLRVDSNLFNTMHIEGWAQDCSNSNIFLKPLFRSNFDPFVNNANLGAIAQTQWHLNFHCLQKEML